MSTFKFKNNNYRVFPPQEGAMPIINSSSITTTWQQDISNIPPTVISLGGSINWYSVGLAALAVAVGASIPPEWRSVLLRDYDGTPFLDWNQSGEINTTDALSWLKVGARMPDYYDTDRPKALTKILEEQYDSLKDVVFTNSGTEYKLFMKPPGAADDTDLNKFYIVVDESDVIDRLKLVKYEKGEDANTSYWFDAGNGSGTASGALINTVGPYSKASGTSELKAFERTFDASDSSIVNLNNNRITIPNHGLAESDVVHYDRGVLHTFDGSSSSIVDTSANTINIPGHGLVTDEIIEYTLKQPGAAIGGLQVQSNYYVEKVDNDKIKLKDSTGGSAISLTSTGLGIRHEISGVFPGGITGYSSTIANPKKIFKVSVIDANTISLKVKGGTQDGNIINFSSVGKGTDHKLFIDPAVHYDVGDKVLVYESKTFHGVNDVGSNIIDLGSAHGYSTGDTTQYKKGADANNALGGIEEGATYYVIKVSTNTLKLAETYADALAGTAITLTDGTGDNHELCLKWGGEVSNFGFSFGSKSSIFSNNPAEVIFTNRTLKKPNWNIVQGKDVLIAKVYKSVVQARAASAISNSTTLPINIDSGGSIVIGSTISGTGIVGTPTVTALEEGGNEISLTLSTAQSLAQDAVLTLTGFMNESLVTMDEADSFYQEGEEVFKSVAGGVEAPGTVEFTKGAQNWKMDVDTSSNDLIFSYNDADIFALNTASTATFYGTGSGGAAGQFILNCENNSHGITIKGPPHSASANYTLTLPNTDGSANQVLKTDGSGNLDWVNQPSSVTVIDQDDMSSNSATGVPSQQSTKAYVDNNLIKKSYFFHDVQYYLSTSYTDVGGPIYSKARPGVPHLREIEFTVQYDYGGLQASTINDISIFLEANFGESDYNSHSFTATHVSFPLTGYHLISVPGDVTVYFGDGGAFASSNNSSSYYQRFPRKLYYNPTADKTYIEYSTQYGALFSSGSSTIYISPDRFNTSNSSYVVVREFNLDRFQSTLYTQHVVQTFRAVLGVSEDAIFYRVRAREVASSDSGVIQEVHGTVVDTPLVN